MDGEGAKWPLRPTICCQKPKVPNNWLRETSCPGGGPRATQAWAAGPRGTLGLHSQCWGSPKASLPGSRKAAGAPTVCGSSYRPRPWPERTGNGWGRGAAAPPPALNASHCQEELATAPTWRKGSFFFPSGRQSGQRWVPGRGHCLSQRWELPGPASLSLSAPPAPRGGEAARCPTFCGLGLCHWFRGHHGDPATTAHPARHPHVSGHWVSPKWTRMPCPDMSEPSSPGAASQETPPLGPRATQS